MSATTAIPAALCAEKKVRQLQKASRSLYISRALLRVYVKRETRPGSVEHICSFRA